MRRMLTEPHDLATRIAPWALAVVFAHPLILWPLIEGVPLDPTRDFMSSAVDQPSGPLNMLFFPTMATLAVALAMWRQRCGGSAKAWLNAGLMLTAIFLLWAGLSTLWSPEPAITLRRTLLQFTIVTAVALPAMLARDASQSLAALFWVCFIAALLNAVAIVKLPPTALGHAGIYPHKNELGVAAAVMALIGLWGLIVGGWARKGAALIMIGLAVVFLVVSRSKTSLGLAVLTPLMATFVLALARTLRVSPAITVPAIIGCGALVYYVGVACWLWDFHAVATALFGDPTLTLRTDIWSFGYDMATRRPWTGYGYEVFWGAGPNSPNQVWGEGFVRKVVHAHNGYLDTTVHLGLIGLAIVLAILVVALAAEGRRVRAEPAAAFGHLSILIFLIFYNLLEVTWFRSFSITSMALVAIAAQSGMLAVSRGPATAARRRAFKRYRWQPAEAA